MTKFNNAEAGVTTSTAVTPGNSAFPDAFQTVALSGGGAAVTYENTFAAHGSNSIKFETTTAGATQAYAQWTTDGTDKQYSRMNVRFTRAPASNHRLIQFGNSAGSCMDLEFRTDQTIRLRNAYGENYFQTEPLPLNQWLRIETYCQFIEGTGTAQLRIFDAADSINALAYFDSDANGTFRGIPTYLRFGIATPTAGQLLYADDFANTQDGYAGPVVPPNAAPVVLPGTYKAVVVGTSTTLTTTATDTDSSSLTYSYAVQEATTGMGIVLTGSGNTRTVSAAAPGKAVIRCDVSDGINTVSAYHNVDFLHFLNQKTSTGYAPLILDNGSSS